MERGRRGGKTGAGRREHERECEEERGEKER